MPETLRVPNAPIELHRLHATRESASQAPCAEIELTLEDVAGIPAVRHTTFDPARVAYDTSYDNALQHSPVFVSFADQLAAGLVDRFGLRSRGATEVGAGDGWFLERLDAAGAAHTEGADPKWSEDVRLTRSTERGLVLARHVLEHTPDPRAFVSELGETLPDGGGIYIETPNALRMLDAPFGVGMLDVVYEHAWHFSPSSIAAVLRDAGFGVTRRGVAFGGQFAFAEGRRGERGEAPTSDLTEAAWSAFVSRANAFRDRALALVERLPAPIVIWGAGTKGKSLAQMISAAVEIAALIDQNPAKRGTYAPGCGVVIAAPDDLPDVAPRSVVVTNPLYVEEITTRLGELRLQARVVDLTASLGDPAHGAGG